METRIFGAGSYINVRPQDLVSTTKRMRSFAVCNGMRDCIFKAQGGYYKLCLDGILVKVFDHLCNVSFEELHKMLKDVNEQDPRANEVSVDEVSPGPANL